MRTYNFVNQKKKKKLKIGSRNHNDPGPSPFKADSGKTKIKVLVILHISMMAYCVLCYDRKLLGITEKDCEDLIGQINGIV